MALVERAVGAKNASMVGRPSSRSVGGAFALAIACILVPLVASVVLVLALVAALAVLGIAVCQLLWEVAPLSNAAVHPNESRRVQL